MSTFKDLFTTSYGLMSAGVIVFMLGMGVFMTLFVRQRMAEDAKKANP